MSGAVIELASGEALPVRADIEEEADGSRWLVLRDRESRIVAQSRIPERQTRSSPAASVKRQPTRSSRRFAPPMVSSPETVAELAPRVAAWLSRRESPFGEQGQKHEPY